MKKFNKQRAKIEILNYIVNQCTNIFSADGMQINLKHPEHGFRTAILHPEKVKIGSLVRLSTAPITKYYLGWLLEKKNGTYLIESIEDGSLCNWSNVGVYFLNPKMVELHPEWKWNDKQFEIYDKWFRACYKIRNCHNLRPIAPVFSLKDNSFTISLRVIFKDKVVASKTFDNYKKVLVKDMLEFYDNAVSKH